jgi:hypothetical protein
MIDLLQSQQLASRHCWSGALQRIFRTLEIDRHATAPEVAESVALFCQTRGEVSGHSLSLLMARSFCAAGDVEAAARVLAGDRLHERHAELWLTVLSAEYPFPELYPLFSSRALRPLQLASAGRLWVLDFGRIAWPAADRTELVLFQTLRRLTETVCCVWNKTDGRGTLGLKGLDRLALSCGIRPPVQHIQDVLARRAQQSGWHRTPATLLLDS